MNRHSFRWTGIAFGALFLSIAANWAVWEGDLLTGREMSYVVSGVLIALGLLGVIATFRRPATHNPIEPTNSQVETTPTSEEIHEEEVTS